MLKCMECGEEVDKKALYCPHCGSIFFNDKGPGFLKNLSNKSGWRYKGRNWGWLSLALFLLIILLIKSSYSLVTFLMFLAFAFTMYLWIGSKDFFRGGP